MNNVELQRHHWTWQHRTWQPAPISPHTDWFHHQNTSGSRHLQKRLFSQLIVFFSQLARCLIKDDIRHMPIVPLKSQPTNKVINKLTFSFVFNHIQGNLSPFPRANRYDVLFNVTERTDTKWHENSVEISTLIHPTAVLRVGVLFFIRNEVAFEVLSPKANTFEHMVWLGVNIYGTAEMVNRHTIVGINSDGPLIAITYGEVYK